MAEPDKKPEPKPEPAPAPPAGDAAGKASPKKTAAGAEDFPARIPGKKKRRGPLFGAAVVLGVLLGLPLLAFLLVVAYLKLGFLKGTIESEVRKVFGPRASVESVQTTGLERLDMTDLRLPSTEGDEAAVQVRGIRAEWDLYKLAGQSHLDRIEIDQPTIKLRRTADGLWNLRPKLGGGESSTVIGEILVRNGLVQVQFGPDQTLTLHDLDASVTQATLSGPMPVEVRAKWPSEKELNASLVLTKGGTLKGNLKTQVDLATDLRPLLPAAQQKRAMQGRLELLLGIDRGSLGDEDAAAGDLTVDGTLRATGVRVALDENTAFAWPEEAVRFRARAALPSQPGRLPTVKEARVELDEGLALSLRMQPLDFEGRRYAQVDEGFARVNLATANGWFAPPLLDDSMQLAGDLVLENLEVRVPVGIDVPTGPTARGRLRTEGLRLTLPDLGPLPQIQAELDWRYGADHAAIDKAAVTLGKVAKLRLRAEAKPSAPVAPQLLAMDLAKHLKIDELNVDVGAFLAGDFGQKLLRRYLAPDVPDGQALPYAFTGKVTGADVNALTTEKEGSTVVHLDGIKAEGLAVTRWPLPLQAPAGAFGGPLSLQAVLQNGELLQAGVGAEVASSQQGGLRAKFRYEMTYDRARNRVTRVTMERGELALAELVRMLDLPYTDFIDWQGALRVVEGAYDSKSQEAHARVTLDGIKLLIPRLMDMQIFDCAGALDVRYAGGRVRMSGELRNALIVGQPLPLPAKLTVEYAPAAAPEPPKVVVKLTWPGEGRAEVSCAFARDGRGRVQLSGSVDTTLLGGLRGTYTCAIDPDLGIAGPIVFTGRDLRLEKLRAEVLDAFFKGLVPDHWSFGGRLPELTLRVERLPLDPLQMMGKRFKLDATASGTFEKVRFAHSGTPCEAERLTGRIEKLNLLREEGSERFTISGKLALDDYEALLLRDLYIPPPNGKHPVTLGGSLKLGQHKDGSRRFLIERCWCNVKDLLSAQVSGTLRAPMDGDLFGHGEGDALVELKIPDLAKLHAAWLAPNLTTRRPALAGARISGAARYAGWHHWRQDQPALLGTLEFEKTSIATADGRWRVRDLRGTLPLAFHRGLWPAGWDERRRGTMTVGEIVAPHLHVAQTPLGIEAEPNLLRVAKPLALELPGGTVQVQNLHARNLLSTTPRLGFDLKVDNFEAGRLLVSSGVELKGLEQLTFSGILPGCELRREPGPIGTWIVAGGGELRAPFFLGTLTVKNLFARGLLGPAPVWGFSARGEGIKTGHLTRINPDLGTLRTVLDFTVEDFSATGLRPEDAQSFVFETRRTPGSSEADEYDGDFAYLLAPARIEDAANRFGHSVEQIRAMRFAFSKLDLGFKLQGGKLIGPYAKRGDYILVGKGDNSPDVQAQPQRAVPWDAVLAMLRAHRAKVGGAAKPPKEGE